MLSAKFPPLALTIDVLIETPPNLQSIQLQSKSIQLIADVPIKLNIWSVKVWCITRYRQLIWIMCRQQNRLRNPLKIIVCWYVVNAVSA